MSIGKWRYRANAISLQEYLQLEMPESGIKGRSELTDTVTVRIIESDTLLLYAQVARHQGGYYSGTIYETPTGGALCGVYKLGSPNSKVGALKQVIRREMDNSYVTNHPGNMGKLKAALENMSLLENVQLTLF